MSDLKQNYRLEGRIEVFYTGGAMRLSRDISRMACACHDEVKVCINTSIINAWYPLISLSMNIHSCMKCHNAADYR